jgi:hypothetical protein
LSLKKEPSNKELKKLQDEYNLWQERVGLMSSEFKKICAIRCEKLSMMLLRIIAYHDLPMEDYEKEYKEDIDAEDEMGHLMKMAGVLLDVKFEEEHKYLASLEGFFSKVRGKLLKVQRGDKVVFTANIDEFDAKSLSDRADLIDELRKKMP